MAGFLSIGETACHEVLKLAPTFPPWHWDSRIPPPILRAKYGGEKITQGRGDCNPIFTYQVML